MASPSWGVRDWCSSWKGRRGVEGSVGGGAPGKERRVERSQNLPYADGLAETRGDWAVPRTPSEATSRLPSPLVFENVLGPAAVASQRVLGWTNRRPTRLAHKLQSGLACLPRTELIQSLRESNTWASALPPNEHVIGQAFCSVPSGVAKVELLLTT